MHYYLSRGHASNGCYELEAARQAVLTELTEGAMTLIRQARITTLREVVNLMEEVVDYSGWADSEYLEIGDKSWHIRVCHDFDCKVKGSSW